MVHTVNRMTTHRIPAGAINLWPEQPESTTRTGGTENRGLVWSALWQHDETEPPAADAQS
ncbi:hypothetical protein GCM10022380_38180 [Amycolatopsis tucumanensis]|uniref:Uncharacterized protein n=2 Tax=Pseudonocardiaceae TaxID=2070 RepID=A0ABP7IEC8_9PSEU